MKRVAAWLLAMTLFMVALQWPADGDPWVAPTAPGAGLLLLIAA